MPLFSRTERFSPTELAHTLDIHVSTIWRWIVRGVRGRKLRSVQLGGRRFILRVDLDAFLADRSSPAPDDADHLRRAQDAGRILDGVGVSRQMVDQPKKRHGQNPGGGE